MQIFDAYNENEILMPKTILQQSKIWRLSSLNVGVLYNVSY